MAISVMADESSSCKVLILPDTTENINKITIHCKHEHSSFDESTFRNRFVKKILHKAMSQVRGNRGFQLVHQSHIESFPIRWISRSRNSTDVMW